MERLFPFKPNWRRAVEVDYEFKTNVLTSRKKKEQRIALRQEPRKKYSFLVTAHKDRYQSFMREIVSGWDGLWWVIDPTTSIPTGYAGVAGQNRLAVEVIPDWVHVGQKVILTSGNNIAIHTVSFVDESIYFVEPLNRDWPQTSKISRAQKCWLSQTTQVRLHTSNTVEFSLLAEVDPGSDVLSDTGESTREFNGLEVFLKKPNWTENPQDTLNSFREEVDYGKGRIRSFPMGDFLPLSRRAVYVGRNRLEMSELTDFFARHLGQQKEFYAPTWAHDITFKNPLVYEGNTFTISGVGFYQAYSSDSVRKAIAVKIPRGVIDSKGWGFGWGLFYGAPEIMAPDGYLIRNIVSMTISAGDTVVTVDEPWPFNLALSEIVSVSWLPVWRFAVDSIKAEWLTDEKGQISLVMQMLEDLTGD